MFDQNYLSLQKSCSQGSRVIWELSLPRSHSTALQIAIAQGEHVYQINEPSFDPKYPWKRCNELLPADARSSSEYFQTINSRLSNIQQNESMPILVVNDLSLAISLSEVELMMGITQQVCITVRDPILNFHSILTRFLNDTLSGHGANTISPDLALSIANEHELTEQVIENLIKTGKINPKHILQGKKLEENAKLTSAILADVISNAVNLTSECASVCWDNLQKQLEKIRTFKDAKIVIINGDDLIKNPENIIRKFCDEFDLSYAQDMVDNWTKATNDEFFCCVNQKLNRDYSNSNAWNGPVIMSSKIQKQTSGMPIGIPLESFPEHMHKSILDAQTIYAQMKDYPQINCSSNLKQPILK